MTYACTSVRCEVSMVLNHLSKCPSCRPWHVQSPSRAASVMPRGVMLVSEEEISVLRMSWPSDSALL